ncbi:hypothetical protein T484DRAFT_1812305 [Baffinella frigidus]|nr:hypothetical protein T484DRAFT_1812305 [Cryptophyta sp. CCMP2293]
MEDLLGGGGERRSVSMRPGMGNLHQEGDPKALDQHQPTGALASKKAEERQEASIGTRERVRLRRGAGLGGIRMHGLLFGMAMGMILESASGYCPGQLLDYFCDSATITAESDLWVKGSAEDPYHSSSRINPTGVGTEPGIKLQARAYLSTKRDFPVSAEAPVISRVLLAPHSAASKEFDLCTRSDGDPWSSHDSSQLQTSEPGMSGLSKNYFVRTGACLHLSEEGGAWGMSVVFVGLTSSCAATARTALTWDETGMPPLDIQAPLHTPSDELRSEQLLIEMSDDGASTSPSFPR